MFHAVVLVCLAQVGPPVSHEADLLKGLGCGRHACRERAEVAIVGLGHQADGLLERGSKSRDAEVASRCRWILEVRRREECAHCKGAGECPWEVKAGYCGTCRYATPKFADPEHPRKCLVCNGSGTHSNDPGPAADDTPG